MIKRFKNWWSERKFRRHVRIAKKCETDIFYRHKLDLNQYWDRMPYEYANHVKHVALCELCDELRAENTQLEQSFQ